MQTASFKALNAARLVSVLQNYLLCLIPAQACKDSLASHSQQRCLRHHSEVIPAFGVFLPEEEFV